MDVQQQNLPEDNGRFRGHYNVNRGFRILAVGDDFTRENLALEADFAFSGERMTRVLDAIAEIRGYPDVIVMDNGPEMCSLAILRWAVDRLDRLHHIAPGKQVQNAFIESFNGYAMNALTNATQLLLELASGSRTAP